jgi:hypothetical protein
VELLAFGRAARAATLADRFQLSGCWIVVPKGATAPATGGLSVVVGVQLCSELEGNRVNSRDPS